MTRSNAAIARPSSLGLPGRLLLFAVADLRFALDLGEVERVIRSVAITPLPGAPPVIRGVVNLHGTIVPIGDIRQALGLRRRTVAVGDTIILVRLHGRLLGLVAEGPVTVDDGADGASVATLGDDLTRADSLKAVVRLDSGITYLFDWEKILSRDDELSLGRALNAMG